MSDNHNTFDVVEFERGSMKCLGILGRFIFLIAAKDFYDENRRKYESTSMTCLKIMRLGKVY